MSPSILQLQSVGVQDAYLTKDPQINMFKYSYYRYVNFAADVVEIPCNAIARFGRSMTCNIPKRGHLLSKLYLHLRLPALQKVSGDYLCWSDALGYAIFDGPIELEIDGIVIDYLYPQCLDILDELSLGANWKNPGKNAMILKSDLSVSNKRNAQQMVDLVIPLNFWFTKDYSSALPLLSMHHQDVRINFRFKDFPDVINYDGADPPPSNIIESKMFGEYVFIDDIILNQFQKQKHTYLIEQMQYNGDEIIPANTSVYNSALQFNHPIKELFFCCSVVDDVENNNYFMYAPLITDAGLLLDGKQRFNDYLPEFYFRVAFPASIHSTVPSKYIYCMPFCIKPEDNQPTGTLNMSRFNDVVLSLKMVSGNVPCYLYTFAISYNVLTIHNGTVSFEFAV